MAGQFGAGRKQRLPRCQRTQRDRAGAVGQFARAVDRHTRQGAEVDICRNAGKVDRAAQRADQIHRAGVVGAGHGDAAGQGRCDFQRAGLAQVKPGAAVEGDRNRTAHAGQVDRAGMVQVAGHVQRAARHARQGKGIAGQQVGRHGQRLARGQRAQRDGVAAGGFLQHARSVDRQTRKLGQIDVGGDMAEVDRAAQHAGAHVGDHHGALVRAQRGLGGGNRATGDRGGLDRQGIDPVDRHV